MILEEDGELLPLLTHVVERQNALGDQFDRIQKPRAQHASVMAADNQATNPLQLEQFVTYCMLQSADIGRSMRLMLRGDDGSLMVPIMALYPLVRAQIECAAMGMWLISPQDRRTRVLRRLQAGHDELTHERGLTKSALKGRSVSDAHEVMRKAVRGLKRQKAYLRAVAVANVISPSEYENSLPGWEEIVREAGETMRLENDALVVVWRLASGFTHPSFRRGASVLEFEESSADGNVLSGVLSGRTNWATSVMSIGARATEITMQRWREMKVQVNPERPVPEPIVPVFS